MKISRNLFIITALGIYCFGNIIITLFITGAFSVATWTDFFIHFFSLRNYGIELMLFLAIITPTLSGNKLLRSIGYIISGLFIITYGIQLGSLITSNAFITPLALENVYYLRLIVSPGIVTLTLITCLFFILFIILSERYTQPIIFKKTLRTFFLGCVIIIGIIGLSNYLLPARTQQKIDEYSESSGTDTTPPFTAFIKAITQQYFFLSTLNHYQLNTSELTILNQSGLRYDPKQSFPFTHPEIHSAHRYVTSLKKPNVIIFFVEGFSARTLGVYNQAFTELTPNLDAFAKKSLVVDHYYNHTAATYRGILGQLCSWYPYQEKSQARYLCLNDILKANGYETFFGTSEKASATRIDETTTSLGFDHVMTADNFSKDYLGNQPLARGDALSDTQFGQALVQFTQNPLSQKPFLVTLYNLGTHAFIDVANNELKYKDGTNYSLNTIHNFDAAFGNFWNHFKNSPLAKNTIIIVTADHAHYAEKTYTSIITDPNYQKLFIDQIPLLIYDPSAPPRIYDARDATSINFTPSLLDYLKLKPLQDPFIGNSLFTDTPASRLNIAAYDTNYYLINNHTIYSYKNPGPLVDYFPAVADYIKSLYHAERTNTIWYH